MNVHPPSDRNWSAREFPLPHVRFAGEASSGAVISLRLVPAEPLVGTGRRPVYHLLPADNKGPAGAERALLAGLGREVSGCLAGELDQVAACLSRLCEAKLETTVDVREAESAAGAEANLAVRLAYLLAKTVHVPLRLETDDAVFAGLEVVTSEREANRQCWERLRTVVKGSICARRLVLAPPNMLTPSLFATFCGTLAELGLQVAVLDEAALHLGGFSSLLAVGRGSSEPSSVVTIEWMKGGDTPPTVVVGKGVCFDAGGLSLKSSEGMMGMKTDMAGAAAAVGLMTALAEQNVPLNVVAVLGLSENMPSGSAMRPGDVMRAHDGRSIEVLNTDYEGRLVLADCLSYARDRYAPRLMVSLGTLTGGVVMALGDFYAGLFSNDEALAQLVCRAGGAAREEVWRLPLDHCFDMELRSDIADLRNIGWRKGAAASVCARFLEGFVQPCPWVHLDIAGVASSYRGQPAHSATGFGVALLEEFLHGLDASLPDDR